MMEPSAGQWRDKVAETLKGLQEADAALSLCSGDQYPAGVIQNIVSRLASMPPAQQDAAASALQQLQASIAKPSKSA